MTRRPEPECRIDMSDGKVLIGIRQTRAATLPSHHDQSPGAERYRARNRGKTNTNYRFNLPYAHLSRWAEPTKLNTLPSDPFDGRLVGPIAHQTSGPYPTGRSGWRPGDGFERQPFSWHDWGAVESEDCGWLTIDTPLPQRGANLPVRVHLHGGGNTQNPRFLPRYTGNALPIVSVMVEYPLSTFGYFSHPAFGPNHQINLAYACVLKALEWVQDHIRDFGGNPDMVMLEGGSAGGQMGSLLMPEHTGQFARVVGHSGGGAGKRATRGRAEALGEAFWNTLVKTRPAFWDRSRSIQQVADEDGIAEALRIGPSPQQILAFANTREFYEFFPGGYSTETRKDLNIWPAEDGEIIRHRSSIAAVLDDAWPISVDVMKGAAGNEACLIGGARNVPQSTIAGWYEVMGIGSEDQAAAEALIERPGDRIARLLYNVLYEYGAERECREHSLRGGRAYNYFFDFNSPASGRDRPGHVNQQAYFLGKPEWQGAMGQSAPTQILYEADLRASFWCSRSLVNFAAHGDPNEPYVTRFTPDYYDEADLSMFDEWAEYGGEARRCNVIESATAEVTGAQMRVKTDRQRALFDFIDARYDPG